MELRLKARPCIQKCLMKDVTDHRMKIVSYDRPSYSTQFHCSKEMSALVTCSRERTDNN
jgi:hypothetical protein